VFVNSMSDLFHARVPLDFIQQAFGVTEFVKVIGASGS
jgi:protein gp37